MFAVLLALQHYKRIYGNVSISKAWINITNRIDSTDIFQHMVFEKTPWVCIFDEMWLNFNSKNFSSKKNQLLSDFFFLIRKYNLSSIFVSQRLDSVPVDMRQLVDYIFELSVARLDKFPDGSPKPIFRIIRQTLDSEWKPVFHSERIFDIIWYLQNFKIKYDTLESSIIS